MSDYHSYAVAEIVVNVGPSFRSFGWKRERVELTTGPGGQSASRRVLEARNGFGSIGAAAMDLARHEEEAGR